MTGNDVKRLALILAVQAEIEGMKADNKQYERSGHGCVHQGGDFERKAQELRNLAHSHDDQL